MVEVRRVLEKASKHGLLVLSPVLASARPANVAMFHIGRVGSTVVAGMLDQHSSVDWSGEFFHPRRARRWEGRFGEADPIRRLRMRMSLAGLNVFGFETKYLDGTDLHRIKFTLEAYVDALLTLGFSHFVLLERKNLLRRFVSQEVGRARGGEWHVSETPELTRVELDPQSVVVNEVERTLLGWFDRIENKRAALTEALSGEHTLHLSYEDAVRDDPRQAYRAICEFIGLSIESAEIRYERSNPFSLEKTLLNYGEVASALDDTPHEWMLSD